MQSKTSKTKQKSNLAQQKPQHEWSFEAIGTHWWVGVYQPLASQRLTEVKQLVAARIEQFDAVYSRFRDDSLVSDIARATGTYTFPQDGELLFETYRQLYDLTNGAVTPLIGQALSDAGYDTDYSLRPSDITAPPKWDDVMTYHKGVLTTSQPVLLDFGAAGKGYLVDIVASLLHDHGIGQYCIDAGGDMVSRGLGVALRIGLEDPADSSRAVGVVDLHDMALCGSAGNRRSWGIYHHILDPSSLRSPQHVSALWVTAESVRTADGIATALFFVEPEALQKAFTFEYLILYANSRVACSTAFPGDTFSE